MLFRGLCLFLFLCLSANAYTQIDLSEILRALEIQSPKSYTIYKTLDNLVIDGIADEDAWSNAGFTDPFIDISTDEKPFHLTKVKMLWDESNLYVYAYMEEDHIWGDITEHDAIIFQNNDFEVFIDPDDDIRNYTEIEVNALNTVWDLMLDRPYRLGGKANDYFEIPGLETAVHIEGTLNDPTDIDEYWSVEMKIPIEVVLLAKHSKNKTVKHGDVWRINFSRVQWHHDITDGKYSRKEVDGKRLPEMNWVWSPQGEINMHIPEQWGYLRFRDPKSDQLSGINIKEEGAKVLAYALFREFKFGDSKHLIIGDNKEVSYQANYHFKAHEYRVDISFKNNNFQISVNDFWRKEKICVIDDLGNFQLRNTKTQD